MAYHSTGSDRGRERSLVNALWLGAAAMVVVGFLLRVVASIVDVNELRITGIALIALGLCVAGLGWLRERHEAHHTP